MASVIDNSASSEDSNSFHDTLVNNGPRMATRRNANFIVTNGNIPSCFYSKCNVINRSEHQQQQAGYQRPSEIIYYIFTPNIEEYRSGINVNGNFKIMNKTYKAGKAKCNHVLDKHFSFYRVYYRNRRNEGRRLYIHQFPPRPTDEDRNDVYYSLNYYNNTIEYLHLHLICENCYQKARKDPKCFINILTDYGMQYFWENTIEINSTMSYVIQAENVLENLHINLCCFSDDITVKNFGNKIPRIDPNIMNNIKKMQDVEYYRKKFIEPTSDNEESTDSNNDNNDQLLNKQTFDEVQKEIFNSNTNSYIRWRNNYDNENNNDNDFDSDDNEDEIEEQPLDDETENNLNQIMEDLRELSTESQNTTLGEFVSQIDPNINIENENMSMESVGQLLNSSEAGQIFRNEIMSNIQTVMLNLMNNNNNNEYQNNPLGLLQDSINLIMDNIDPSIVQQVQNEANNILGINTQNQNQTIENDIDIIDDNNLNNN